MRLEQDGADRPIAGNPSRYRDVALDLTCEKMVLDGMCPRSCDPGDGSDGYCAESVRLLEAWADGLDVDG